jgi:hypothetical protein
MKKSIATIFCLTFILILNSTLQAKSYKAPARENTVLLITDESLKESWQDFADWKTRQGKNTKIVTTKEIAKNYKGKDIQQKIKACCLDHIKNHKTLWVVLGGDSLPGGKGLVPDRDTNHNSMLTYKDMPADIYYLSLKSWDGNEDGVYGDWKKDKDSISYTDTEACIGRIPVRTVEDVKAYTAKIIAYESNYPEKKFATEMIYACPIQGAFAKLKTSQKELAAVWKQSNIQQYYHTHSPWDKAEGQQHKLLPNNWVDMINKKTYSKIHMHGHGMLPIWVLDQHKTISAKHVKQLKNKDHYLTITTVSCFTGQFDGVKDPSIVESMLRQPEGGAVTVVAPAREGVPVFHDPRNDFRLMMKGKMDGTTTTMTRFWKYALSKNLTAGEALRAAKKDMVEDAKKTASYHLIQCELNLLGDPTIDMRAKVVKTPKLTFKNKIAKGSKTIKITSDIPGVSLCLWKGDEIYAIQKADDKGLATFKINSKSTGKILVTAYGPSLNSALGEITIE